MHFIINVPYLQLFRRYRLIFYYVLYAPIHCILLCSSFYWNVVLNLGSMYQILEKAHRDVKKNFFQQWLNTYLIYVIQLVDLIDSLLRGWNFYLVMKLMNHFFRKKIVEFHPHSEKCWRLKKTRWEIKRGKLGFYPVYFHRYVRIQKCQELLCIAVSQL